jgi:hypothetical protein
MGVKQVAKMSALTIGLGALLAGTALAGATGELAADAAAAQEDGTSAKQDRSRRVCRNLVPSGSRLSQRVCRTQAEWDEQRDRTQEGALDHQLGTTTQLEQAPRPR